MTRTISLTVRAHSLVQTVMSGLVLGDQVEQEADVAGRLLGEALVAGQHLGLGRDVLHEALVELLLPHRQADRTIIDVHLTTPPTPASSGTGSLARAEGPQPARAPWRLRGRPSGPARKGPSALPKPPASRDHRLMTLDGADPQVLAEAECLRLLAGERLGRVAITVKALPVILPVRFALDRDEIVFRAPPGGVLAEATRHAVIAFEADGSSPARLVERPGHGLARHLAERDRGLTSLPPWSSETDVSSP